MPGKEKLPLPFRLIAVFCCGAFVTYAFYFNTVGSNATVMMDFYNITEAQQGFILTAQSIGALGATFFLALWGERYNKVYGLALGVGLLAFSGVMIGLSPVYAGAGQGYAALLLLVLVAGCGFTFIDVMVNGSITDNFGPATNTALPLTHAFYGIGSMLAPLLVTAVVRPNVASSFAEPFLITGVATVAVFLCLAVSGKKITPATKYADMTEVKKRVAQNPAEVFRTKESWIFLAAAVGYFAFQIGIAVWLPTYCQKVLGMEYTLAGRMLTMFFGGALVMRLLSPLLLKKIPARLYYFWFTLGAGVFAVPALFLHNIAAISVLIAISGFLQGANVALLILMGCAMFPRRTASASAIVSLAVGVSSMVFPFVMGVLAESSGFLAAFLLVSACCAASAFIIFFLGKKRSLSVQ